MAPWFICENEDLYIVFKLIQQDEGGSNFAFSSMCVRNARPLTIASRVRAWLQNYLESFPTANQTIRTSISQRAGAISEVIDVRAVSRSQTSPSQTSQ